MSDFNVPQRAPSGVGGTTPPVQTSTTGSTADTGDTGMKDRVSGAASQAGDAGKEVAQNAKERAGDVAQEAKTRARGLVDETRSQLRSQAGTQQERVSSGLRSLSGELGKMANSSEDPGYATDLVKRAGDVTDRLANWFEQRGPDDLLREVQDFGRRRPGMFVAIAAGAGLVVGRLVRGVKDASSPSGGDTAGYGAIDTTYPGGTSPAVGGSYPGGTTSGVYAGDTTGGVYPAGTTATGGTYAGGETGYGTGESGLGTTDPDATLTDEVFPPAGGGRPTGGSDDVNRT